MGVFEHFPYSNFHNLNLDKILERTHSAEQAAAASAADAAASAADAAASHAEASSALNRANQAYNIASSANTTANYAKGKVDLGVQYEVIYDDVNQKVTVTDLYTNEVISDEDNPLTTVAIGNLFFGISGANPPQNAADYCYPNAVLQPKIKLVWLGASTTKYTTIARAAYKGLSPKVHLEFFDPAEDTDAVLTFSSNFVYANATYMAAGLPPVDNADNGKFLQVVNGAWKDVEVPSAVYQKNADDELTASFNDLKADLYAGRTPTIVIPDGNDTNHYRSGVLGEISYDSGQQTYNAYFIIVDSGTGNIMHFYSSSQNGNMILD